MPFELLDNRIFIEAWINERGPFAFIFDTGGSNIVAPHVVDELGLGRRDGFAATGAGASHQQGWRVDVASARIGPTISHDVEFMTFSLTAIQRGIGLPRLDGVFGHELLRRFVVAIDYDARELVFAEPDGVPGALLYGEVLDLTFSAHLPRIAARLDDQPINAVIDSGDRSSLTLLTPFVERLNLRDRYTPTVRAVTGWGVGGPILADVARVPRLGLGSFAVERVVTRMAMPGMGAFSGNAADASIGSGVLKRFGVTFDYPRSRMILRRGDGYGAPDPLDRSGMWLTREESGGPNFRVAFVVSDGPAARAGLREGDVIIAVDGEASASQSLLSLRARLSAADVARVSLRRADGAELVVRLEDLLESRR